MGAVIHAQVIIMEDKLVKALVQQHLSTFMVSRLLYHPRTTNNLSLPQYLSDALFFPRQSPPGQVWRKLTTFRSYPYRSLSASLVFSTRRTTSKHVVHSRCNCQRLSPPPPPHPPSLSLALSLSLSVPRARPNCLLLPAASCPGPAGQRCLTRVSILCGAICPASATGHEPDQPSPRSHHPWWCH
jgi:hypothetical protein